MPNQRAVQEQFLHAFQRFWHTDPGLHLLAELSKSACQGCAAVKGWAKGGCLVCAYGIKNYVARSLEASGVDLEVSLVAVATDETEAAHVLVTLCKDGEERFLDATGIWTREALLRQLAQEYQYDAYSLVRWEEVVLDRVWIPFDARIAQSLEEALVQALGPFSPVCFFPVSDLLAV